MAVVYCTGYTRQMLADNVESDDKTVQLLFKPYEPRTLLGRVRAVLAARARAAAATTTGSIS
jgi:DNA-binding response OmpR family regulator